MSEIQIMANGKNGESWQDRLDKELYDSRKIFLNEYITAYSFDSLVPYIEHINLLDKDIPIEDREPVELIMCSGGGSFHDGVALITAIRRSKTPVHALVYSYAYSMGLAIMQACHKRYMAELGSLLYHEVMTETDGSGSQIKRTQKELERIQRIYDDLVMAKSKVTQAMLEEQKEKINDWVIDFAEAKRLELIDGSVEELK